VNMIASMCFTQPMSKTWAPVSGFWPILASVAPIGQIVAGDEDRALPKYMFVRARLRRGRGRS
jgi:hypothetical protein